MAKERLYQDYVKKFRVCFGKPLTEGEILQLSHKTRSSKLRRALFEQKYLPRLREMALVTVIPKEDVNLRLLKKYYGISWKKMTRKYYIFTPKTARMNQDILKIVEKFGEYIDNWDYIADKLDKFITALYRYELFYSATITPEERFKKKPEDIKIRDKIKKKYGTLFDIMFENNKKALHPEAFEHLVYVKTQFIELVTLLNQQINIGKIFHKSFNEIE